MHHTGSAYSHKAPVTLTPLEQVRQDINALLKSFFAARKAQAAAIDPSYVSLWQATEAFALAGGKRFRAYLTVLSYQAAGGQNYHDVLPVAASQELLNLSLLVHDDIIDRDFIRHGVDNVAGTFLKKYRALGLDEATAVHYAHSAALLAGDLLLAAAQEHLMTARFSDSKKRSALQLLNQGITEVTAGELLDTEAALYDPLASDSLRIARYKTAGYSVIAPLCIGAILAGAHRQLVTQLRDIGESVGIAYQLADDLLGLFGETEVIGKPALSDLQEGKRTYIIQQTLRRASPADQKKIKAMLGQPDAGRSELEYVRTVAENSGAKARVEMVIASYGDKASDIIEATALSPEAREQLSRFITAALKRQV